MSGQKHGIRVILAAANRLHTELMAAEFKRRECGIEVVGLAFDAASLLQLAETADAEIVLSAAELRDGFQTASQVVRKLRTVQPKAHVVLMLGSSNREQVIEAFRQGAHGVLSGDETFDALCKCIEVVMQGEIWASNKELSYLLEAFSEPAPAPITNAKGTTLLTKREEDVVRLVAEGMTNREISARLSLSEHTVRNYLFKIFDKLGISSRVELVLRALDPGPTAPVREQITS
jgi:DNA-binding NarL/FixJ family response regulator